MKLVSGFLCTFAMASCVASAAPPAAGIVVVKKLVTSKAKAHVLSAAAKQAAARRAAAHAAMMQLAPADEYFGPLKQSFLGIRNTLRDLGLRYDVNHDIGPQTVASANLTERSILDWEKKYPRDHGIPVQIYTLQRLYTKILTPQAREKAQATANWLLRRYARSPEAQRLRAVLATEVLPPLTSPVPLPATGPTTMPAGQVTPMPMHDTVASPSPLPLTSGTPASPAPR